VVFLNSWPDTRRIVSWLQTASWHTSLFFGFTIGWPPGLFP
jgi:hypothetical protein